MLDYMKQPDYVWYKTGQDERRHANLPPFEFNEESQVKVMPSEIYCRLDCSSLSGRLCHVERPFLSVSNLKTHIKGHKINGQYVAVERRRPGSFSVDDEYAVTVFYRDLRRQAEAMASGRNIEDETDPVPISTQAGDPIQYELPESEQIGEASERGEQLGAASPSPIDHSESFHLVYRGRTRAIPL
ncbi:hypothetical protein N658DRAFT_294453 [Parathielavia hyrcaniae]|uniref:Uncharacterized protein n=1 Tax=Parathielavia hyrcaniae TaxID=113614 RepID=A0AAN6SY61_9PEZI|nr:hypothetical protein N658DRAFT_294453 [Parathielavia hyrcaniae]